MSDYILAGYTPPTPHAGMPLGSLCEWLAVRNYEMRHEDAAALAGQRSAAFTAADIALLDAALPLHPL